MAEKDQQNKMQKQSADDAHDRWSRPGSVQASRRHPASTDLLSPFSSAWWSTSPFEMMRRFNDEVDRWFGGTGLRSGRAEAPWMPNVEIFHRGNELMIRADLPGVDKDNVDVEIADDVVTIRGERKQEREEEREGYYRSERSYGTFYRTIPLPEGTITDSAKANFTNGVLEIVVQAPPREVSRGRRIEIGEGSTSHSAQGTSHQTSGPGREDRKR
jgi:HSP20 family protein